MRTRARLIEAAGQLIGERGFEGVTLEAVAARAGMSRGAIYGNFKDREELFLAVVDRRWRPIVPAFEPGAPLKRQLRILGEAVADAAPERARVAVGAASFQLYALTHPDMRERIVRENAEIYRWAAEGFVQVVPEAALPMPAARFVRVLHALTDGLMFAHFMTPELIDREVMISAFEALG